MQHPSSHAYVPSNATHISSIDDLVDLTPESPIKTLFVYGFPEDASDRKFFIS